ncbi:uridine kinase [Serinibacter arcticus]|uniref:Uridine kinase n=1 Tax=Serinibacter arcticus TaxID=1655435 RepID=A0A2U1ZSS9_9MICO|nr:uridine kinase [Serinibacter arcticus]PWD49993.1 uridine kinase [Serinibacter arcticus]
MSAPGADARDAVVGRLVAAALGVLPGPARRGDGVTDLPHGVTLVCVDGLAGAGKTTLAADLAGALRERGRTVAVVHMDDLYLGWTGLLAAHREVELIAASLERGETVTYRRYDWERDALAETVTVPRADVLLLEGCGSAPPAVDGVARLVVAVTAADDLRLTRGLARDGEAMRPEWLAFMADERALEARDRTTERADVVLDATGGVLRWGAASVASDVAVPESGSR